MHFYKTSHIHTPIHTDFYAHSSLYYISNIYMLIPPKPQMSQLLLRKEKKKKPQLAHNHLNCGSTLHRNPATQCSVRTADWNWLITPLLVIFEHLKWKHPRALCQDCISTKTALAQFSIQLSGSNEETVTRTVQLDSVTFQVWCDC